MKTTINFLAAILSNFAGITNGATMKYSLQPLPSYWAMTPAKMLMNNNANTNCNSRY